VTTLYRVLPWLPDAPDGEPGHPLFVPGLAAGRIDNPEHYLALYCSDGPAGACAEAFDYKPAWDAAMLRGAPSLPGSVKALATYTLDDVTPVCDLDDAGRLVALGLRPSQVVTRDRTVTRAWALRLFAEAIWCGVRWWSYYDPRWGSHGIWGIDLLSVNVVEPLTLRHPALLESSEVLNRPFA
jgi:hypothetical protein